MPWEALKAHGMLCTNGCVLLLAEKSLLFFMQDMVPVLPHVPCDVPQLFDHSDKPTFACEIAVFKATPTTLLLGPTSCPTPSERGLPTHQVLEIQHLPKIFISKFKIIGWPVLPP
jgi:hypothetical protein